MPSSGNTKIEASLENSKDGISLDEQAVFILSEVTQFVCSNANVLSQQLVVTKRKM